MLNMSFIVGKRGRPVAALEFLDDEAMVAKIGFNLGLAVKQTREIKFHSLAMQFAWLVVSVLKKSVSYTPLIQKRNNAMRTFGERGRVAQNILARKWPSARLLRMTARGGTEVCPVAGAVSRSLA
jgi:hypothetical protein